MKPNVLGIISIGLTLLSGAVGVAAGVVDKKIMKGEIAKQVAETITKN